VKRRTRRLAPAERDRRVREAERAAYAHFGAHPEELVLHGVGAAGRSDVRVLAFDREAAGRPVVLLHGIASVSVLAAPLLPYLGGRPVYAVDWPGHGLSGPGILSPDMAFRTYAVSALRSILDQLDLPEVDLVGHSLGAQISLYAGLDLGPRMRRLVLLGAPGASLAGTRPLPVMKLLAVPRLGEALLSVPLSERTFVRNNAMALGPGALDGLPGELVEAVFLLAGRTANAPSIASFFRGLIRGRVPPCRSQPRRRGARPRDATDADGVGRRRRVPQACPGRRVDRVVP